MSDALTLYFTRSSYAERKILVDVIILIASRIESTQECDIDSEMKACGFTLLKLQNKALSTFSKGQMT